MEIKLYRSKHFVINVSKCYFNYFIDGRGMSNHVHIIFTFSRVYIVFKFIAIEENLISI